MRALAAAICLAVMTPGFAADIYSWRDKDGKVHYSDVPPAGNVERRKLSPASTPAGADEARSRLANQELEFRKRREEAGEARTKADKDRQQAETMKANCAQAREHLAALNSGQRMARVNAAGEREFLDDAQRAADTERAKQAVADWCK